MAGLALHLEFELIDLTTPEPRREQDSSNISSPPIIDLVTPEPALVVDLSTPKLDQLVAPVVDLSTPKLDQLVAALSMLARALAMSQHRPPGL
jgi:protein-tyrosine phosphatase